MKYFDITTARHTGRDVYDLLILHAKEPYGYDDMVHAYWSLARNETKGELLEAFRNDPARPYMIERMRWLQGALLRPVRIIDQLPAGMYGTGFTSREDPESIMPRLAELDTSTSGRMWHDVLEWLRMEYLDKGEPVHLWEAWGDRCGHSACEPKRGCDHCKRYRCWGCQKVFYWDNGGTDTELCDECWSERHGEGEEYATTTDW